MYDKINALGTIRHESSFSGVIIFSFLILLFSSVDSTPDNSQVSIVVVPDVTVFVVYVKTITFSYDAPLLGIPSVFVSERTFLLHPGRTVILSVFCWHSLLGSLLPGCPTLAHLELTCIVNC